jgi:hypothetical protein
MAMALATSRGVCATPTRRRMRARLPSMETRPLER